MGSIPSKVLRCFSLEVLLLITFNCTIPRSFHFRLDQINNLNQHDRDMSNSTHVPTSGGWDYAYLHGNFVIVDLDFWYTQIVSARLACGLVCLIDLA